MIVEIIIHVYKAQDEADDADIGSNSLLFSIVLSVAEKKIEILEKYAIFWSNTEFTKLIGLVDKLQVNNELEAVKIRVDYASIFQESDEAELNLSSLDLSEISNKSKSKSTTKAKSKVKGPNKVRSSFTKVSSPVRANKNKNNLKIKESSSLIITIRKGFSTT